jgi:ABC-type uncharacterized transport system involved in gliding motility auxiliary subunit
MNNIKSNDSRRFKASANALIILLSIIGIIVVLNVIALKVFGQIDLTDNDVYTLSDVSREAVKNLSDLEVRVYISKELPDSIELGYGMEKKIRGIDREFVDKLRQYQSYSDGNMRLVFISREIETQAEKAKLQLFSGKQAEVSGGKIEFAKYALGATFHYKNQMEVFPLALEPAYFEFEITKILLRLKDKHDKALLMKDVLESGEAVFKQVTACNDKLKSYKSKNEEKKAAIGGLLSEGDNESPVGKMRVEAGDIKKACGEVQYTVDRFADKKGLHENLDLLLESSSKYAKIIEEFIKLLQDPQSEEMKINLVNARSTELFETVDKDNDALKDSPGKQAIGFMCGHREFCPFPEQEPMVRPEIAGLLGQKNMFVQHFVNQARHMEDQINMINSQILKGLFTRRGLNVRRVDTGEPVPDNIASLIIYGPEKEMSDYDLYQIDQFLLSGKSVVVLLNNFDVSVFNIRMEDNFETETYDVLQKKENSSNISKLLDHYGIVVNKDLVTEKRDIERIKIIMVRKQGQYTIQEDREFPYPLLPMFKDFDPQNVLVRNISNITLPYVSSLKVKDAVRADKNVQVSELIKSSGDSVAKTGDFDISPPVLFKSVQDESGNGPHTVSVLLNGQFISYFRGKEIPMRPEKKKEEPYPRPQPREKPFKETGKGRLLVIGSNLGLENLSSGKIFEGFEMSQLTSGQADFFLKLKEYIARFQNWQLRLSQIGSIVQDNIDFLFNILDWSTQQDALVAIRSKGIVKRPLTTLSENEMTAIRYGVIVGLPLLFIGMGLIRSVIRRKKVVS